MLNVIRRKLEWNESLTREERLALLAHPRIVMGITPVYERLLRRGSLLSEETRMTLILLIVMASPDARRAHDEELPPAVAAARAKQVLGHGLDAHERLLLRREALFVISAEALSVRSSSSHWSSADSSSPMS